MIEINLLPEELKPKPQKFSVDPAYALVLIPVIFAFLIVAHLALGLMGVMKGQQLRVLNNKLKKLQPQLEQIMTFEKEQGLSPTDIQFVRAALSKRIIWSKKLNTLSLSVSDGIWFNSLSVTSRDLVIKASVVSLEKEEIGLINKFMKNLRQDEQFMRNFDDLQLGTTQRKQIGGFDVVDFSLTAIMKESDQKQK